MPFRAEFTADSYRALVDRALTAKGDMNRVLAIVEYKIVKKSDKIPSIAFQEAAEIVGRILSQHRPPIARLLVGMCTTKSILQYDSIRLLI